MATSNIDILVRLKDEATSAFQKMGGSIKSSLENAQGASFAFAGAMAGVGIGVFSAVKASQEAVRVQNQLEAVLKSTGGAAGITAKAANDLALSLSKVTNFDDEAVLSAQNMLLTFTKVGKEVFPQATETILDMATATGTDAKGAAIQLGKALNDPINGISSLTRVGVTFSDEQKKMIEKMVKTNDIAGAQKIILKELATEFGGSAKAAADPLIQMNNAIGDAWESIGAELTPAVIYLSKVISSFATETLPPMIETVKGMVQWFGENKLAIYIVAGAIVGALVPAIYAAVVAFGAAFVALAPFMLGGMIIAGLIAGIVWIVQNWELIRQKAIEIWTAIAEFFTANWAILLAIFTGGSSLIVSLVINNWEKIKSSTYAVWNGIKTIILGVWEGIKSGIMDSINWIIDRLNDFINTVNGVIAAAAGVAGVDVGATIGNIPRLAAGGIVTKPTVAMIGEGGEPEAVIPLSKLQGLGGGGVTVNITGPVYTGAEYAREMGNEFAKLIKRQVRF